jgi:hypothetical protein
MIRPVRIVDGLMIELTDDEIAAIRAEANAAIAASATPRASLLSQEAFWKRTTEAEAELIDAGMKRQPARTRRIFDSGADLDTQDPMFAGFRQGLLSAGFEPDRVDELLQPTH